VRVRPLLVAVPLLVVGCGDDGSEAAPTTTAPPTTQPPAPTATAAPITTTTAVDDRLVVLVTNDDGVGAPGIDALVEALRADPTLLVVVVAPAENQSGSGDATTLTPIPSEAATISGYPAVAVDGKPADAVNHALDFVLTESPPDLVISGINEGQNLGPIVDVSGTIGAARTASRRGIPSVAVSQGFGPEGSSPDYVAGVEAALDWLAANRDSLEESLVVSINVPTCGEGEIRGTVEVPVATDSTTGNPVQVADCTSTLTDPTTDIAAFNAGFVAVSEPGLG
jgi:5'-nucleotidase